jgi:hypothetical protein
MRSQPTADKEPVMNLTARVSRRLAAGIGLACAAIALPTAALASSAAASAPSATAAAACRGASTEVWTGQPGDGTAGTSFFQLEISNIGHHACTLFGYPGVSAVNGSGKQVGLPASHSGNKALITIAPGGTAHVVLAVTDPGAVCAHPVSGSELRVFAPGQTNSHRTPFAVSVCPHQVTLHVDAVHAGAGIPFFSTR